jgi:hypothetical protein
LVMGISVQLTKRDAVRVVLVVLFIWFTGYVTGVKVTRIWEKTAVKYDCIFMPAPENSSRV